MVGYLLQVSAQGAKSFIESLGKKVNAGDTICNRWSNENDEQIESW